MREGIAQMVNHLGDGVHIWQAASGDEAMEQLGRQSMDLVLLDLNLPDMDGFAILHKMLKQAPAMPVVILSAVDNPVASARCIADGARAYVNKSMSTDDILHILRSVLQGKRMVNHSPATRDIEYAQSISPRQRQMLKMLQQGMRNKEIANAMGISESTVKVHTRAISRLLHVNNRHAAVCKAAQLGLLE